MLSFGLFILLFFWGGGLLGLFSSSVFWVFMVGSTKVRVACPSISFLFACLGASLGVSRAFLSLIEDFVFEGSSLSVALVDLVPLLCQSIDWFKGIVGERGAMSEVRSSELETWLSSSDSPVEMEEDTAISIP